MLFHVLTRPFLVLFSFFSRSLLALVSPSPTALSCRSLASLALSHSHTVYRSIYLPLYQSLYLSLYLSLHLSVRVPCLSLALMLTTCPISTATLPQREICNPLICVKELFEASKSMVGATFVNHMLRTYPDVTLNHLEDMMTLRDDVKAKEVRLSRCGDEADELKRCTTVSCAADPHVPLNANSM